MNVSTHTFRALRLALLSSCMAVLSLLPHSAIAADKSNGQKIYLAHCAGCHGENGRSIMPRVPNIARSASLNQPDLVLIDKIRSGSKTMPPFLGIIQEKEFYDVISHLRTLR